MASSQTGAYGVVFGNPGAHVYGGSVTLQKYNDGSSLSMAFTRDRIFDEDGVPRTAVNHGTIWTLECDFTPKSAASSGGIANAKAQLFVPEKGERLAITGMNPTTLNVTWAIIGASIRYTKAGVTTYSLQCEYSPEGDIVTPIT